MSTSSGQLSRQSRELGGSTGGVMKCARRSRKLASKAKMTPVFKRMKGKTENFVFKKRNYLHNNFLHNTM